MKEGEWIHANCAYWTDGVYETELGGLVLVHQNIRKNFNVSCSCCQKSGANISCCFEGCHRRYHFKCAHESNCIFLKSKQVYCKACWKKTAVNSYLKHWVNIHPNFFILLMIMSYVSSFDTERRLFVMKQNYGQQNLSNDTYEKGDWLVKSFKKKKLDYDCSSFEGQKILSNLKE